MRKIIVLALAAALAFTLLVGLPGIPAMRGGETQAQEEGGGDAVKTGLYVRASAAGSGDNAAEYALVFAAVTVDDAGVISACKVDALDSAVHFNENGVITTNPDVAIRTKNELGAEYGMKAYGGAKYEWNEQAAALADYAVGKTVEQLRSGAANADGYAADADLASSATIQLAPLVDVIEAAAQNARPLGAQRGDELRLASIHSTANSENAGENSEGTAQLDSDIAAVTLRNGMVSSCVTDGVQAQVRFDGEGRIAGDLGAEIPSKNQLGAEYGMKVYGGAKYEWNEQAANFSAYVTGKDAGQIAGIAVDESGKAADADLASGVTIAVGGFQNLVLKAVG